MSGLLHYSLPGWLQLLGQFILLLGIFHWRKQLMGCDSNTCCHKVLEEDMRSFSSGKGEDQIKTAQVTAWWEIRLVLCTSFYTRHWFIVLGLIGIACTFWSDLIMQEKMNFVSHQTWLLRIPLKYSHWQHEMARGILHRTVSISPLSNFIQEPFAVILIVPSCMYLCHELNFFTLQN